LSPCLTKHHSMKTYWGSAGLVPCIIDLSCFTVSERAPGTYWVEVGTNFRQKIWRKETACEIETQRTGQY
jgi:hypothetical protein